MQWTQRKRKDLTVVDLSITQSYPVSVLLLGHTQTSHQSSKDCYTVTIHSYRVLFPVKILTFVMENDQNLVLISSKCSVQ